MQPVEEFFTQVGKTVEKTHARQFLVAWKQILGFRGGVNYSVFAYLTWRTLCILNGCSKAT